MNPVPRSFWTHRYIETIVALMADTKRDALCTAALELFAEQGAESTNIQEIAERAGGIYVSTFCSSHRHPREPR